MNEVSSPLSPEFQQYLTPQKYAELYGSDPFEISSLISFLISKGLAAHMDPANPNLLLVSGKASSVESAFQVSLDRFQVANQSFFSPLTLPQLPSQFSFVQTIYGLSNYGAQANFASPMYVSGGRISGKPDQSDNNNIYYSPSELYQIYNSSSLHDAGYNGSGITIAIIDAYGDPYVQQELDNFSAQFNLPQVTLNQICVDGPCDYASGIAQGWQPEIALDTEWAHAMAPDAAINLYIGVNASFPIFDAVEEAVNNASNSIISMSWGSPENSLAASSPVAPVEGQSYPWLDQVFQQAAAEGITAFTSSGDYGAYDQGYMDETLPYGGASYPSTDPYVTSVGGTSLYMNTTSGTIQFPYSNATGGYGSETAWSWNDEYPSATGGGYSTLFATPPWQGGPGFDSSIGTRGAPDVAWDADPSTGVVVALYEQVYASVVYYVIGGTSVGSPSWAGSIASIEQKAGHRLGLISPDLYSILNNPQEYSKAFHDVTIGNNNPNSAGVGWNPLTGMGSPNLGELANYLAPSGSFYVSVTNSLTGQFASSFAYGSQINFAANVTSGGSVVSSGTVVGTIAGPSGQIITSNIPFSFDSGTGKWTGSYAIKSTDPPGEWVTKVFATSGAQSGWGVTTLSVGDGIDVFLPEFNTTTLLSLIPKFTVGQTINITAEITFPSGSCCVITGNFRASFNENSPSGKSEGSVPLAYNSSSDLWTGQYKIPPTVDQDSWAITVSGGDANGNLGSTYGWLYVGLNMVLHTDSPTYVLGSTMSIKLTPKYTNGLEASTGSFTAYVSDGTNIIATLPLALNPTEEVWEAQLPLKTSSPTGFYQITVNGTDGQGSAGTAETVVRVAPYTLQGSVTIPNPEISVNGGSEPMIAAKITYPNGSLMTVGSVNAFVSLDHEGLNFLLGLVRMTYNPSSGSFVAPEFMTPSSPENTSIGTYLVSVQGFDPEGNFANLTSYFFVQGESHSPITISDNSQFTASNGVILGNGTDLNPYVFAGWNTSSISISSGATASYQIVNDWVTGSSGDGIYLNTPSTSGALIEDTVSDFNQGNGINVNGVPGITLIADQTSDNALNGVVAGNVTGELPIDIALVDSNNNGRNGFTIENSRIPELTRNVATSNAHFGYYLINLVNASLILNNASMNSVGVYFAPSPGKSFGEDLFLYSLVTNNNIGMEVNGLDQNLTGSNSTTSSIFAAVNMIENNTEGVLAGNNSVVQLFGNTIGFNGYGVEYRNSVAVVSGNVIAQNNGSAVDLSGPFTGIGGCIVSFANTTISLYSSCLFENFISLNGKGSSSGESGISEANLNGSLVYDNFDSHNSGDGLTLSNVTGSAIALNTFDNNTGNGISASLLTHTHIDQNNESSDGNGILLYEGSTNQIDRNNMSQDSLNGISINSGDNNVVTKNRISIVGAGCATAASCTFAGGIELSNSSSMNALTSNAISNVHGSGKIGAGIVLEGRVVQNLVYDNNATSSDAGIVISDSPRNTVSGNNLALNEYGVYLIGSSNLDLASNTLSGNQQDLFPNSPLVIFTGLRNGTSVGGIVTIHWNSTGQAISNQSLTIDGATQAVTGSSFSWNSTSVPDGIHIITIRISNDASQNASASIILVTTNHEFLTVETIGPEDVPLSNSVITLNNASYSATAMTDSSGRALFHGLTSGNYNASTAINGTSITSPVSYAGNSTVILFVPTLITTVDAPRISGGSVPIQVSGNLTASQLSKVSFQNSTGSYTISFDLTGPGNTVVQPTLAIPKSFTTSGLVPVVLVNGNKTANQIYSQDASFYYVKFLANFANGTQKVTIQLSPVTQTIDIRYGIVIVVVIALIAAGIILARSRSKRTYYLPSQSGS